MNRIAIIGGGASGLMAALFAARAGTDVTVYEHNQSVGKKILASGNGRCNIINTFARAEDYSGEDPSFAAYALKQLSFRYFEKLCLFMGLLLDVKEDGRCYPLSNEAKSVVSALKHSVEDAGVKILTTKKVISLTKQGDTFILQCTDGDTVKYDKVLIATGSEAAPQLGATADGYALAKAFGHSIIPTYPSLVQLHLISKSASKMSGVKTSGSATLFIDGKKVQQCDGDILFTDYGISGLAILDISQKASHALLSGYTVSLSLDLLPRFESLDETLRQLFNAVPRQAVSQVLSNLIPFKLVNPLLQESQISPETSSEKLTPKEIKKIAYAIKNWKFDVSDTHGFKHAEVSGGGVSTSQINPKTMESTLVKGLYFAGEVIDIVGRRGGFNFHFAWASGMIAGKEMAKQAF